MTEAMLAGLQALEQQMDRVADTNRILDIFYRYIHYFSLLHREGILSTFADRDDVSLELAEEGVVVGPEQLRRHFSFMPVLAQKPGILVYHYVTCPVVEIAADGATAKLTCFAPGCDAMAPASMQDWIYGKYYVDLIRQTDGQWKVWHVRWFRTFETPVTVGWLKEQTAHDKQYGHAKLKDAYAQRAEKQPSTYPPYWKYPKHFDPTQPNYLLPEPPKAYTSWDGMTAMDMTRTY